MKGVLQTLAFAAGLVAPVLADLDPIVIKGSKFFYQTNGSEFFIQGVAYQQDAGANGASLSSSYTDPLADTTRCTQDIPILKQLNTNAIRVYAVNPAADHSTCMNLLQQAGIYLMLDLADPTESIIETDPEWNDALYARYTSVVDAFAGYSNVIGFFAGNEVATRANTTNAIAYVKAAVRDTKAYIKSKNYRTIGVGYAAADNADIRILERNYLNCGDQSAAIDFWGYNIYEWCGDSNYIQSGYADRVAEFETFSVPSFFAEYGCITPPRDFTEVQALFGSNMTQVFSGGFVYMYFEEANNYGLVDVRSGTLSKLAAFTAYSTQINNIAPTGVSSGSYNPSNTAMACPTVNSTWLADATPLPPTPNSNLCNCMQSSLSCVVKSSIANSSYAQLFNTVCGYGSSCNGIASNATTGTYGPYSVCSSQQQLSYAFDAYYKSQKSAASACDFGGAAQVVSASAASSCSAVISSASASVAAAGSGGSSSGSTSSKAAAVAGAQIPGMQGMGQVILAATWIVGMMGLGAGILTL